MIDLPQLDLKNKVTEQEWQLRVDLAACYRLVEHFRWGDLIYTHLSARLPGTDHYLVNAFGLTFDEVTASNLVKVDLHGNIIDDTPFSINPAGFTIHSAIHEVREDAHCVIHLHTKETIAVATQKNPQMLHWLQSMHRQFLPTCPAEITNCRFCNLFYIVFALPWG